MVFKLFLSPRSAELHAEILFSLLTLPHALPSFRIDVDKCVVHIQVICTKVRDGNNRIVKLKEGDPTGRHVVIVDDLVQSGGTLIECQVGQRQYLLLLLP